MHRGLRGIRVAAFKGVKDGGMLFLAFLYAGHLGRMAARAHLQVKQRSKDGFDHSE